MKNKSLFQSFKNAFSGFRQAFASERNMKIHAVAAALVIAVGFLLKLNTISWIALIIAIELVFVCELINTAIEELTDMVNSEYSEQARRIKDISASAVMASALISVVIGILVLYNPIIKLLK